MRAARARLRWPPRRPARDEGQPPAAFLAPYALILGLVLLASLLLRLWGLRTGLPFLYNVDEGAHFVPRAIGMFDHSYDPGYFINPPAFTYLLHFAFWLRWGGDGVREAFAADPTPVFALARALSALLGTIAAGLLAWAATRFFDRRVALVAAALMGVAFLPVHYGHFALNDAPTLAPLCLSLVGVAGILRGGGFGAFALAGAGVGLAAATKYTAGIGVVPIVAAALLAPGPRHRRALGLMAAGMATLAAFVIANPHALLSYEQFRDGLQEQSAASSDGGGKLGLEDTNGFSYYLGTLTWGLGWIPLVAAFGGGVWLTLRDRRLAAVLIPAPVLFGLFMGLQDRFFARWLLPIYPFLILLGAWATVQALDVLRERRLKRAPAWTPAAVAAVLLGAQGLVYAIHNDIVLSRTDTRALTREWMVENIPEGSKIVVEPVVPHPWVTDPGRPGRVTASGARWIKRASSKLRVREDGTPVPFGRRVKLEDYERTLRPDLLSSYTRGGYCWLVSGSTQYGRAFREPDEAPWAIRYYEKLRREATVVFEVSPLAPGAEEPPFSFDDSFNYRPLSYERPGPRMVVYRLQGDECG